MADVFISYKREDRDRIAPLARALEARGYTVWWDLELVAGQKWAKQIKAELDAANCVVVAWTRVSVADDRTYSSEFVENEADEALRRGVLVPALMDPGRIAWTHQKVQYASLIDWSGEPDHPGLAALIAGVVRHAGARATPEEVELDAWSAIENADTAEAFREFVHDYPKSRFVAVARSRAADLEEIAAWASLGEEPHAAALREFLLRYPVGRFAEEAAAKIETLEREEHERQAKEEAERIRLKALIAEQEARERRAQEEEAERAKLAEQEALERRAQEEEAKRAKRVEQEALERRVQEEEANARKLAEQEALEGRVREEEAERARQAEQEVRERRAQEAAERARLAEQEACERRVEGDAHSALREGPSKSYKHRGCFAVVVVIAVIVVVAAILIAQLPSALQARNPEANAGPSEELRPTAPTSDFGLEFYDLRVERDFVGATPVLIVNGEVRNISNEARMVPPVRLSLRERGGREVLHLIRVISERSLAAGSGIPFQFRVESPPVEAVDIETTFEATPPEQASSPSLNATSLERAAEDGNLIAQYELALQRISAGRTSEGIAMLRGAADRGFPMAQYRLAKLYERGEGVPADLTTARQWTERAAAAGNRRAMHDLGVYFARGEGAPFDEAAAARWFRQAAELGVADSQYNLGVLYQQGRGVDANPNEALFWFLVAARQGDRDAAARATELEADRTQAQVQQARTLAQAFQPRAASAVANGVFGPRPWATAERP